MVPWVAGYPHPEVNASHGDVLRFVWVGEQDVHKLLDEQHYKDCNFDGARKVCDTTSHPWTLPDAAPGISR